VAATATLWATGTPSTASSGSDSWSNPARAAGANDNSRATYASATNGEAGTITCTGYGADTAMGSEIPASVDSVNAIVYYYVTGATTRWSSVTAQLTDGGTPLGSSTAMTLATSTSNSTVVPFTGVAAWSNMAGLGVQLVATKYLTTASTVNVDAVGVVVNWTASAVTGHTHSGGSYLLTAG